MDVAIKKSKTLAEIFEELKGDADLQEVKVSVSIEIPINGAEFHNGQYRYGGEIQHIRQRQNFHGRKCAGRSGRVDGRNAH